MATHRLFALLLTLATVTSPALAQNIITVTNTNDLQNGDVSSIAALELSDGGDGVSLREAVAAANSTPNIDDATPDRIHFAIEGEGPHVITKHNFWSIQAPVVIDGYTQPGASPATTTQPADLRIELTGSQQHYGLSDGCQTGVCENEGAGSTITGLAVSNFVECIRVGHNNSTVTGNYLGTDATGSTVKGCNWHGIYLDGANIHVGGQNPAARNVVVGSEQDNSAGIRVASSASGNVIAGNFIGTDPTGTSKMGRLRWGILHQSSDVTIGGTPPGGGNVIAGCEVGIDANRRALIVGNYVGTDVTGTVALGNDTGIHALLDNTVGGNTPGSGNLISGNDLGIQVISDNQVMGNRIGTDAAGTAPLANRVGVRTCDFCFTSSTELTDNIIGGTTPGSGNVIAFNTEVGVWLVGAPGRTGNAGSKRNAVLGNAIFANGGSGIDLSVSFGGLDGVTPNDPGDVDTGPNLLQNFPVLTSAQTNGASSITIDGLLDSTPDTANYRVELFASTTCNAGPDGLPETDANGAPIDYGEGETFLGATIVDTDANGEAFFSATLAAAVPGGSFITATATDPFNNTSEFAQCIVAEGLAADEQLDAIAAEVEALKAAGALNKGQANALLASLEGSKDKLARGRTEAAIQQLEAFGKQVEALLSGGVLTAEDGQALIDAAEAISLTD